jgi:hypothetical protein
MRLLPSRPSVAFLLACLVTTSCGGSLRRPPGVDAGTNPARIDATEPTGTDPDQTPNPAKPDAPTVVDLPAADVPGADAAPKDLAPDGQGGAGGSAPGPADALADADLGAAGTADASDAADGADAVADAGEADAIDTAPMDPEPPFTTCGGLTCPALFGIVASCRPTGMCQRQENLAGTNACFANGVRARSQLDPTTLALKVDVTKTDGITPCYSVEAAAPQNGTRALVLRRPDGSTVATGFFETTGPGRVIITCNGSTAELSDASCVPIPLPTACAPGTCP